METFTNPKSILQDYSVSNFSKEPDIEELNKQGKSCTFALKYNKGFDKNLFVKTCRHSNNIPAYDYAFKLEYFYMDKIKHTFPNCRYFPHYESFTTSHQSADGYPQIVMETISGITLEELLQKAVPANPAKPSQILAPHVMHKLCKQIFEALDCLHKAGIMYFDLSPENIIVVNSSFDIRMVDFTFCYYLNKTHPYGYKVLDYQLNPTLPVPVLAAKALMCFCTRLFFAGKYAYQNYFCPEMLCSDFFIKNYRCLFTELNPDMKNSYLLFQAQKLSESGSSDNLAVLRSWYCDLIKCLEYQMSLN